MAMDIFRFGIDIDGWPGFTHDFLFGIIKIDPLFIASHNASQKTFFFYLASKEIERCLSDSQWHFQLIRVVPIFLPFESFPLHVDVWKQPSE